ncbi:MAG: hypothetical protein M1820_001989 [Bogoriella megaspora]|nr:MAG: hypothetical protein M1820_001989 [Bogoriella megaspora]
MASTQQPTNNQDGRAYYPQASQSMFPAKFKDGENVFYKAAFMSGQVQMSVKIKEHKQEGRSHKYKLEDTDGQAVENGDWVDEGTLSRSS